MAKRIEEMLILRGHFDDRRLLDKGVRADGVGFDLYLDTSVCPMVVA